MYGKSIGVIARDAKPVSLSSSNIEVAMDPAILEQLSNDIAESTKDINNLFDRVESDLISIGQETQEPQLSYSTSALNAELEQVELDIRQQSAKVRQLIIDIACDYANIDNQER